jgi:outer membrane protein assembly factor BamB
MNHRKRLALSLATLSLATLAVCASASAATVTISPLPGTPSATAQTQISFLGASAGSLGHVSVVGSASGAHSGRLRSYSSALGASFLPSRPFTPGERVTVHARWSVGKRARSLSTFFTVAHPAPPPNGEFPAVPGTPADVQNFQSQPELHPPAVTVRQLAGAGSAPGYLFAGPFLGPGQWGPMIFDNAGHLVWFRPLPPGLDAADFRTQAYRGRTDLTWWQGRTLILGYGLGEDVIAGSDYKTVAVVKAGNGLQADEHEFTLTPRGAAFVLAYSPVQENLTSVGGPPNAIAVDGAIQEIDIHTGLVMWEWHSLGHVSLSESYSKPPATPGGYFDYFHVNSLTTDRHGNLLISARNTWALYQIDAHSGAVTWRLGGKKSTFTLGPGVQFAYQHNALWLPGGDISLFDDEGAPPVKPPSRGEIVKLDYKAKTATLAGQFVHGPKPLLTNSQGNLQALPGGGWMVGWGGLPNLTEFNAGGQVLYDAQLPAGEFSYRVYREPWSGRPSEAPAIAAKRGSPCPPGAACLQAGGKITVYASWNGATGVAAWQLLSGTSASRLTPVSTTPRSGFETMISAPAAAFFQVRALSAAGKVLGSSKVVQPSG